MKHARIAAAALLAAIAGPIAWSNSPALAKDNPGARYQGWGLAIAYLAIGERCTGALSSEQMSHLQAFVANGLAFSRQNDKAFDHEKFVDTFHDEMVVKYSNPSNCTAAVVKEAREAAAKAQLRLSNAE